MGSKRQRRKGKIGQTEQKIPREESKEIRYLFKSTIFH